MISTSPPGVLHGGFHARFAIVLPRVALIVSSAVEPQIVNRGFAADRPRVHVVELEAAARVTPPPVRRDVAALLAVSQEHRSSNRC